MITKTSARQSVVPASGCQCRLGMEQWKMNAAFAPCPEQVGEPASERGTFSADTPNLPSLVTHNHKS